MELVLASHPGWHWLASAALIIVVLALLAIVRNNVIRRRLRFTLWTSLLFVAVHAIGAVVPALSAFDSQRASLENLLLTLAIISGAVSLLNPWFRQGVPDHLPSILQDTIVLGAFAVVAVFGFKEQLALTSAVGAAVIGFALQDTLGNAIAGLAIQIDRPFKVGHWITVGSFEGAVTEITWRATKLRTKAGNLVVVPNNIVSKEAINNYSEPEAPTRLHVEVGVSYDTPVNVTRAALLSAVGQAKYVLKTPPPEVLLVDFAASSLLFRVRFWIAEFSKDEIARDEVRTFIYYELRRRHIEIPYPIQVEYSRHDPVVDREAQHAELARVIAAVPVFADLSGDAHLALARGAQSREYAVGETIVREGDASASMFLVERGSVDVVTSAGQRVATTSAGGYFGEMSLLTGAPRSASVVAATDCALVEIDASSFRDYVQAHPDVLAQMATAAAARQHELDVARANTPAAAKDHVSLLSKMRQFFGLS